MRSRTFGYCACTSEGSDHDWEEEGIGRSVVHCAKIQSNTINQDVQFFKEASEVQFDETGNRKRKHRYGDEDELEMEQQERKMRQMLNKDIKAFSQKIVEAASSSVCRTISFLLLYNTISICIAR